MTSALAFDTLAYTKKLRAAGVPEKQAEVQAETFAEIVEDRIATKQDIIALQKDIIALQKDTKALQKDIIALQKDTKALQKDIIALQKDTKALQKDIKALEKDIKTLELTMKQEFKLGLANTKTEIIKWVAGMLVAQAAIVATLVKLL